MSAATTALAVPDGAKARRTYRALVRATRDELAESGGRFSGEAVAQRAGMAPATFYAYFPSKNEALAAALDEVLGELVASTLTALSVERLLDESLRAVLDEAVRVSLAMFVTSEVVLRVALAQLPESRTIRDVYRVHQRVGAEGIELFLRRAAAAGKVRVDDVSTTTTVLLVLFQGLNNPLLLHGTNREAASETIVTLLERLLAPAA